MKTPSLFSYWLLKLVKYCLLFIIISWVFPGLILWQLNRLNRMTWWLRCSLWPLRSPQFSNVMYVKKKRLGRYPTNPANLKGQRADLQSCFTGTFVNKGEACHDMWPDQKWPSQIKNVILYFTEPRDYPTVQIYCSRMGSSAAQAEDSTKPKPQGSCSLHIIPLKA